MKSRLRYLATCHAYQYGIVGEFQLHRLDDAFMLWAFEIYPPWRRQGHATGMLAEALALTVGYPVHLWVKRNNTTAIKLYERAGFTVVRTNETADEFQMAREPDEKAVVPTVPSARQRAIRHAWRTVVRTVSLSSVADVLSVITSLSVLYVLLRVLFALQQATCVIGGADLIQCLK